MSDFKECLQSCIQNDPPPCEAVCPLGLDIRDFIAKLQRGAFDAAYRAYLNAAMFPRTVSSLCSQPCKSSCVFSGGGISLRELEKACIAYTRNPLPNNYNLPTKPEHVAVVGAGLSGLSCALRLASKKYRVTVYEANDRVGGKLWELIPDGSFLEEIEQQFSLETVEFQISHKVESLDALDADAIYLATGENGETFGCHASDRGERASDRDGVFLGGMLVGHSIVESVADGLTAARAIERYWKTGGMNEPPSRTASRLKLPKTESETPPVLSADGVLYTRDEAIAEANRCKKCRCDACVRYCDLMRSYGKYPSRIEEEVNITIRPVSVSRNARVATRMISTCDHCGLCKEVCPAGIDTGEYLLDSHVKMREKNAMPWVYHEFWLRDMEFSNGEAALLLLPAGKDAAKYLYFPGCRLSGSDPNAVVRSFRALQSIEPDTALLLGCCGAPASWAGETELHEKTVRYLKEAWGRVGRPTVIFACTNCKKEFARYLPNIPAVTIYDLLLREKYPVPQGDGRSVAVFDPCASRGMPETQQSVRAIAQAAGYTLAPLPMEKNLAQCCGWGGQTEIANPDYTHAVMQSRAEASPDPYLVYCANCRDVFAKRGKPTLHILDILFPDEQSPRDWTAGVPTATQSRENRRRLKKLLTQTDLQEADMVSDHLIINEAAAEKMDRAYILREDVMHVLSECTETGKVLFDPEQNVHIAHGSVGHMTLWVTYRDTDEGREIVNTYAHRMKILEDVGDLSQKSEYDKQN